LESRSFNEIKGKNHSFFAEKFRICKFIKENLWIFTHIQQDFYPDLLMASDNLKKLGFTALSSKKIRRNGLFA